MALGLSLKEVVFKIHINIGSNQDKEKNILLAIDSLKMNFFDVVCSRIYQSKAFGFDGDDFYNIGVNAKTNLNLKTIIDILHQIENKQGRDRNLPKFSMRKIDLDLVLYDKVVDKKHNIPRDDILKYNFVLLPLAELSPNEMHPIENKTYAQLSATIDNLKSYNLTTLTGE